MEKIALEEHFRVPHMPEYSGAAQYLSDKTAAKHIDDLWRFDSRFKIMSFGKTLKKRPSAYIRENVSITTAGLCSTPALRCALEGLGEDRVLFSVDYPYESSRVAGDWLDMSGLPADTLKKVASGNAKRLLHLP